MHDPAAAQGGGGKPSNEPSNAAREDGAQTVAGLRIIVCAVTVMIESHRVGTRL